MNGSRWSTGLSLITVSMTPVSRMSCESFAASASVSAIGQLPPVPSGLRLCGSSSRYWGRLSPIRIFSCGLSADRSGPDRARDPAVPPPPLLPLPRGAEPPLVFGLALGSAARQLPLEGGEAPLRLPELALEAAI